jgi:hypothetical protein
VLLWHFKQLREAFEVTGDGPGEFKQSRKQLLRRLELDLEPAGAEADIRSELLDRSGCSLAARRDRDSAGRDILPHGGEIISQPAATFGFCTEIVGRFEVFELPQQVVARDQKGLAGLESAKPMQESNGLPPPDTE